MSNSVQSHRRQHPWDSPGKNTGVGCHFLLQYKEEEYDMFLKCVTSVVMVLKFIS